jgi:nitroreductase
VNTVKYGIHLGERDLMDVFEAIERRHSVRAYLPDPVPEEKLARVLEAGRLAPSAANVQPWHFVVVKDVEKRNRLAGGGKWAGFLAEAPIAIVGCGDKEASPKWCVVDTTIALENMVLAATGEGLGTCWIGSFVEAEVKKLLNLPDKYCVVAILSLGFPREKVDLTGKLVRLVKPRKKIGEIVSLDTFGTGFSEKP